MNNKKTKVHYLESYLACSGEVIVEVLNDSGFSVVLSIEEANVLKKQLKKALKKAGRL